MSEFFRTHAPPEFGAMTLRELAARAHEAEDTGNDVLLLRVWDELERRERTLPGATSIFRDAYIRRHARRAET